MVPFMKFPTTIDKQQEMCVPMKQTNSSWSYHNDHLESTSIVALLHNPL